MNKSKKVSLTSDDAEKIVEGLMFTATQGDTFHWKFTCYTLAGRIASLFNIREDDLNTDVEQAEDYERTRNADKLKS